MGMIVSDHEAFVAMMRPPQLSYGEIMDRLYVMWVANGDGRTFEEFVAPEEA